MNRMLYSAVGLILFAGVVSPAVAYIGPGAGLSLLGALWGLVAALGAALLFVAVWPFRRMLRRKRENRQAHAATQDENPLGAAHNPTRETSDNDETPSETRPR